MQDPTLIVALAAAGMATIVMGIAAALKAWEGWLALKKLEFDRGRKGPATLPAARIEMADLKERVRKLEAIAAGIDL